MAFSRSWFHGGILRRLAALLLMLGLLMMSVAVGLRLLPGNGLRVDVELKASGGEFLDFYLNERADSLHRLPLKLDQWELYRFDISDVTYPILSLRVDPAKAVGAVTEFKKVVLRDRSGILYEAGVEGLSQWRAANIEGQDLGTTFRVLATTNDPRMVSGSIESLITPDHFSWWYRLQAKGPFRLFVLGLGFVIGATLLQVIMTRRSVLRGFSEYLVLLVVLSGVLAYRFPWSNPEGTRPYTAEAYALHSGMNILGQIRSHQITFLMVAVMCGLLLGSGWNSRTLIKASLGMFHRVSRVAFLVPAGVIVLGVCAFIFSWTDFLQGLSKHSDLFLASCLLGGLLGSNTFGKWAVRWDKGLIMCVAVFSLLMMVPGFFSARFMPVTQQAFQILETHYSVVLGHSARLAAGLSPFEDVKLLYGIIFPMLVGIFEKFFGTLSLGQYLTTVQAFQCIFLVLALIAYRRWPTKTKGFLPLAVFLVLPWVFSNAASILFPNHSAWRNMNFALGVFLLISLCDVPIRALTREMGLACGIFVLINPETGLAVSAGFIVFILAKLRGELFVTRAKALFEMGSFAAISMIAVGILYWLGLGEFPFTFSRLASHGIVSRGKAIGVGPLYLFSKEFVISFLIFVHMVYICIFSTLVWSKRRLSTITSLRLSLAVMILVWFAFFVRRPESFWYLWTILFLYSFFMTDYLEAFGKFLDFAKSHSFRGDAFLNGALVLSFIFFVGPFSFESNRDALWTLQKKWRDRSRNELVEFSGVRLPGEIVEPLKRKIEFLVSENQRTDLLYFTFNSFTIPQVSNIYPKMPVRDLMDDVVLQKDYNQFIASILRLLPSELLFDAPEPELVNIRPYHYALYARIKTELRCRYRVKSIESGWEILERTLDSCI